LSQRHRRFRDQLATKKVGWLTSRRLLDAEAKRMWKLGCYVPRRESVSAASGLAQVEAEIVQPAAGDGGSPGDVIARLSCRVTSVFEGSLQQPLRCGYRDHRDGL
jgi:hypothetical protein